MGDPKPSRKPLYPTEFGRALDTAAGRIARALVLTVVAVGCAYIARPAETWTFYTFVALGTGVASGCVALQSFMAYSAAIHAMRPLPGASPGQLTGSRPDAGLLAALIVLPFTLSVAITAPKALENLNQPTFLGGGQ